MTTPTRFAGLVACLLVPLLSNPVPDPLYLPRAIRHAYENGTRSPDGNPGPRYWQNRGRYDITIAVAPPNRTVRGRETIVYHNNSPDTLRALNFKLLLNIHKPGAPRMGGAGADYLTDGVHVDSFAVNGAARPWGNDANVFTNRGVRLPAPLAPHDSVTMTLVWHYDVSIQSGREGQIDPTTFYLAYFYPRVAVYDDTNGWDTMDFTDGQEFYSDFNDYQVDVQAPRNFVVWGTGTLLNPGDVLQPGALQRYQASLTSDSVIHVASHADMTARTVTRDDSLLTWRFRASNVPDMAFGVSSSYDWDAASVVVDTTSGRRASVQAAFADSAADYHHMVHFGQHALSWLSTHWPGVPYPYEKTTVFQGFADMEYPMMVNDNTTPDTTFSKFVAAHEIAHTWFPFYMGIDETRYGFMDEGWATTFEYLINQDDMGPDRAATFYKQFRVAGWINDPSPLEDLPIITPEDVLKGAAYGNNAYGKASLGYLAVKELLGDATFRACLHGFMARWHGKHPIPWDFFNTVNDISRRDLNWFWKAWYFDNSYIDLRVTGVTKRANGTIVTVQNVGGMPAPFDVKVKYADGTTGVFHQTPAAWAPNHAVATITLQGSKAIASLTLDGGIWMDATPGDNAWPAH